MNLKETLLLVAYWLLFIVIPVAVFVYPFRGTLLMVPVLIAALAVFILLGRKGFPEWKNLWKSRQDKK